MGGKSTYLRQAAMLVLMAQMGCLCSRRQDALRPRRPHLHPHRRQRQRRARPLHLHGRDDRDRDHPQHRDRQSLILLDEMGRGTATFDGLSLAWATVEYLHAETGARTLFATHYHELTMLAEKLPRVRNLRVGVKEAAGGIVFLHSIEPGAATKSYGIEVARLAGLPTAVIGAGAPHPAPA